MTYMLIKLTGIQDGVESNEAGVSW